MEKQPKPLSQRNLDALKTCLENPQFNLYANWCQEKAFLSDDPTERKIPIDWVAFYALLKLGYFKGGVLVTRFESFHALTEKALESNN